MISVALLMRQNASNCKHVVRWLSSVNRVSAPTSSIAVSKFAALVISEPKPSPPLWKDAGNSPQTTCFDSDLRCKLYRDLAVGYQLPTVWYNNVMKKSIIDPLSNCNQYDLPTLPGHAERKEEPEVSTGVTSIEDPSRGEVVHKMLLPWLLTIRHKKMKKHKLKKLRKRMRFVMRKRRLLKTKRREREMQQYEREQKKEGELYSAESYIDEQMTLARKSGWHIDIIAEYNREKEKEKAAAGGTDTVSHSQQ